MDQRIFNECLKDLGKRGIRRWGIKKGISCLYLKVQRVEKSISSWRSKTQLVGKKISVVGDQRYNGLGKEVSVAGDQRILKLEKKITVVGGQRFDGLGKKWYHRMEIKDSAGWVKRDISSCI